MNPPSHLPAWALFVAEVSAGAGGGHVFAGVPSWVGGALSALVVGVVLRVLDPLLRRVGERLAARSVPPPSPPAPPSAP